MFCPTTRDTVCHRKRTHHKPSISIKMQRKCNVHQPSRKIHFLRVGDRVKLAAPVASAVRKITVLIFMFQPQLVTLLALREQKKTVVYTSNATRHRGLTQRRVVGVHRSSGLLSAHVGQGTSDVLALNLGTGRGERQQPLRLRCDGIIKLQRPVLQ